MLNVLFKVRWLKPKTEKEEQFCNDYKILEIMIPKIAHRIWFGSSFPKQYKEHLVDLCQHNPEHVIKLWSSPESMSAEDYQELHEFCDENKIILCNIHQYSRLLNLDLIEKELAESQHNEKYKRLHYVRAADIARIAILEDEGGVYSDTDSRSVAPYPQFISKYGLLLKAEGADFVSVKCRDYPYFFISMMYDFIASEPKNDVLQICLSMMRLDYKTYNSSGNKLWETSSNFEILRDGNIKLTGTALKWALNYAHQQDKFLLDSVDDLFIETTEFMEGTHDKSWLAGFSKDSLQTVESQSLNKFIDEIEGARNAEYPIRRHNPLSRPIWKINLSANDEQKLPDLRGANKDQIFPIPQKPLILNIPRPTSTEINFVLSLPEYHFSPVIPTTTQIADTYQRHGGGLLARFSLFANPFKTPGDIIMELQKQAQRNPDPNGASRKTLEELNIGLSPS